MDNSIHNNNAARTKKSGSYFYADIRFVNRSLQLLFYPFEPF